MANPSSEYGSEESDVVSTAYNYRYYLISKTQNLPDDSHVLEVGARKN